MDGILTVEDTVPNRDGLDRLVNFEQLQFIDGAVQLDTYVDTASHYCASTANSTGAPAQIHVVGSPLVSHQDLSLTASNLPSSQFGYFLCSQSPGLVVGPGGSQGNLCLRGVIGRFVAQVQMSGSDGTMGIDVNMAAMPDPVQTVIQPGETWHFACWFRDLNPTPTSNFTGGVSVQFQ